MDEFKSSEVIFKYYMPENRDDVWLHMYASTMFSVLNDIDNLCRNVIKYENGEKATRLQLAEEIRRAIHESIDMDKIG